MKESIMQKGADWMAVKHIDVSMLVVGESYTRMQLAEFWGYNGTRGMEKGILPAANHVVALFTTEKKSSYHVTKYVDHLSGSRLEIQGQASHLTDRVVMDDASVFYSFYRSEATSAGNKIQPFLYLGRAELIREECRLLSDEPSRFVFHLVDMDKAE